MCTSSRRIGKRSCGRAHVTRARCILDGTCCSLFFRMSLRCFSLGHFSSNLSVAHICTCPHMQCGNNKIWRCRLELMSIAQIDTFFFRAQVHYFINIDKNTSFFILLYFETILLVQYSIVLLFSEMYYTYY